MKKLNKLKLNDFQELNEVEMKDVIGGVSRDEYCQSLLDIASGNTLTGGAAQGWWYGWTTHCS